ncbi:hypothetical protein BsWGS_10133 [Bradybaena similaris]
MLEMKIPFPAFIKRIFETPAVDKNAFDVSNRSSNGLASSKGQVGVLPTMNVTLSGIQAIEKLGTCGQHLSTPIPQTPAFLKRNCRYQSFQRDPAPGLFNQERMSWVPAALTTPMFMSSLSCLESSSTPADAFLDILEIIDEAQPADSCETASSLNASFQMNNATNSGVAETPRTDDDLIEMLINIAENIESEAAVSSRSYLYTRPEDVLLSRKSGQRKCQHAKRMTEDEEKYYKRNSSGRAKARRRQYSQPEVGVRQSTRKKRPVQYF